MVDGDAENATVVKNCWSTCLIVAGRDPLTLVVIDSAKVSGSGVNAMFDHPVIQRFQQASLSNSSCGTSAADKNAVASDISCR